MGMSTSASCTLSLTEQAAAKVGALILEENDVSLKLRVYVTGGGCSGFQYGFAFDDQVAEDDLALQQHGVTLLVDSMSHQYLQGASIDFQEDLQGARFVVSNPNATATCGCGSSFAI
jgi:iron-sulfur cluster insertion protein